MVKRKDKVKARLIVSYKCHRHCENCCNDHAPTMLAASPISIDGLARYEKVMISGGEPMLFPKQIGELVRRLREKNPQQEIYLYTSLPSPWLISNMNLFDGITVGLHVPYTGKDASAFWQFQKEIGETGSFRLFIDKGITESIPLIPGKWDRIGVGPMLPIGECPVPEGEDLLELRSDLLNADYEEYLHENRDCMCH